MADLFDVADAIKAMAEGFEGEMLACLGEHATEAETAVRDQIYSGLSGDDSLLEPTYDNDPYFDDPTSPWYKRAADYKGWKMSITPPSKGWLIDTPPRPAHVPNLYIDGTFHSTIYAQMNGDQLSVKVSGGDSEAIVAKWGDNILRLGSYAIDFFNYMILSPRIETFFAKCGW